MRLWTEFVKCSGAGGAGGERIGLAHFKSLQRVFPVGGAGHTTLKVVCHTVTCRKCPSWHPDDLNRSLMCMWASSPNPWTLVIEGRSVSFVTLMETLDPSPGLGGCGLIAGATNPVIPGLKLQSPHPTPNLWLHKNPRGRGPESFRVGEHAEMGGNGPWGGGQAPCPLLHLISCSFSTFHHVLYW